jgi:HPt (histidine-containing phosphotransfer) domain-containing protein
MENLQENIKFRLNVENLYDLAVLEEMDDNEYLVEIVTLLLKESPGNIKEMKDGLLAGNATMVCKNAHKLKGSVGIIQAEKLIATLGNIEAIAKKGVIDNELMRLVENAQQQYNCIEKALRIHIEEIR